MSTRMVGYIGIFFGLLAIAHIGLNEFFWSRSAFSELNEVIIILDFCFLDPIAIGFALAVTHGFKDIVEGKEG